MTEPPPFEQLYDESTLRRLGVDTRLVERTDGVDPAHDGDAIGDADEPREVVPEWAPPPVRSRVGRPLSGLMLAAAMSGLGEVLEPEKNRPAMVEFDPGHDHFSDRPVEFVLVPGCPKASRILLRPWLQAS
ncbi:MAG: hypothetical protein HYX32_05380 [Actinobacteria bacterium]|nr:hypothetical protein [Actinomycetota bacterium]